MSLSRNTLYTFLILASLAGYIWLFINQSAIVNNSSDEIGVCLIKHTTNIPCPSCGSTRSIVSLLNGEIQESLYWNPMGIIILLIMIVAPIWIVIDYYFKKDSLLKFYIKMEVILRQRRFAVPAILLVFLNWVWNIYKGL